MWLRSAESRPGHAVWEQYYGPGTALEIWPPIEAEALGKGSSRAEGDAAVSAVVFGEDKAGDYCIEPPEVATTTS